MFCDFFGLTVDLLLLHCDNSELKIYIVLKKMFIKLSEQFWMRFPGSDDEMKTCTFKLFMDVNYRSNYIFNLLLRKPTRFNVIVNFSSLFLRSHCWCWNNYISTTHVTHSDGRVTVLILNFKDKIILQRNSTDLQMLWRSFTHIKKM